MFNEAHIIANLAKTFPDYIGDDAAVISQTADTCYVITKDLLVEDVHFRTSYFDPASLAYKALQVNLSDLAAMGAMPLFILLGISVPRTFDEGYLSQLLQHFAVFCQEAHVTLIGGDTTQSSEKLFLSVTAIGSAKKECVKYRHTAHTEDILCIAGNTGYAQLGLTALENNIADLSVFKQALLRPTARVLEGLWLAQQPGVTAMMDLSDGLYVDLKKLCAASSLRAQIDLENLTPSAEFMHACDGLKLDVQQTLLVGAEDYSLLLCITASLYQTTCQHFFEKFGYPLRRIGQLCAGFGVEFAEHGLCKTLSLTPFSHFGEPL